MTHQAINLKSCEECNCGNECTPNRIARPSDRFFYQFTDLSRFLNKTNIIIDGTFIDLAHWSQGLYIVNDNLWTASTPKAEVNGNPGSYILSQAHNLSGVYFLSFNFSPLSSPTCFLDIMIMNNSNVWSVFETITNTNTTGYYGKNINITQSNIIAIGFRFHGSCGDLVNYIGNIRLLDYSFPTIRLDNCCNNSTISLPNTVYDIYTDRANIDFKWSDYVTTGTWKLAFSGNIINDGGFEHLLDVFWLNEGVKDSWVNGCWDLDNTAYVTLVNNTESNYLTQYLDISQCRLTLNFTVAMFGNYRYLGLYINNELFSKITNSGDISIDIDSEYLIDSISFKFFGDIGSEINIKKVAATGSYHTSCFDIGSYECSILCEATLRQDSYNLKSDYIGIVRCEAEFHKITPDDTEKTYRDSSGVRKNIYTDKSLLYDLEVYESTSEVIEALLLLTGFDSVRFNKVEYVKKENNPAIKWQNKQKTGSFMCQFWQKNNLSQKIYT